MPKLPRNMVRRGKAYYFRKQEKGIEKYVALGSEHRIAHERYKDLKGSRVPIGSATVKDVAERWLESYVKTARTLETSGRRPSGSVLSPKNWT